jgi:hypothetical protein
MSSLIRSALCAACGRQGLMVSATSAAGSKLTYSISTLPASIFEKSRISLMTLSRASVDVRAMSQELALFGAQVGVERQFDHADDAIHRGPDFMAHVGQEVALRAVRGIRSILGALQLQTRGLALVHQRTDGGNHHFDVFVLAGVTRRSRHQVSDDAPQRRQHLFAPGQLGAQAHCGAFERQQGLAEFEGGIPNGLEGGVIIGSPYRCHRRP